MTATLQEILRVIEQSKGNISLDAPLESARELGVDNFESILPKIEDNFDRIGWERLFHDIPRPELELLGCIFLGMRPHEIMSTLGYKNIARYYAMSARLRAIYRQRKTDYVDYT
jgi:hypothetical protein